MNGKLTFHIMAGAAGFIITFLLAARSNLWTTSLYRALIAFAAWFILSFLLSWIISVMLKPGESAAASASIPSGERTFEGREIVGERLDLSTPVEEQELKDLVKPAGAEGAEQGSFFTPLDPPKLVSTKNPEELAKAVRHLTEE